jgi:hypothetical protein
MSDLTVAQANAMLAAAFVPGTVYYLSLHTGDPGTTGATEVAGGSYARQSITFGTPAAGSQMSAGAHATQSFTGMPVEASGCPFFGVWTAAIAGTYLGGGTTSGLSGAILAGSIVVFAAGAVALVVS